MCIKYSAVINIVCNVITERPKTFFTEHHGVHDSFELRKSHWCLFSLEPKSMFLITVRSF